MSIKETRTSSGKTVNYFDTKKDKQKPTQALPDLRGEASKSEQADEINKLPQSSPKNLVREKPEGRAAKQLSGPMEKSQGESMKQNDFFKSIGVNVVSGENLRMVNNHEDTTAKQLLIKSGDLFQVMTDEQSGRIGEGDTGRSMMEKSLAASDPVMRALSKGRSAKGDDNGDGYGSKYLKDTHGEMVHSDKHVTRAELDDDKAEEIDATNGSDHDENPEVEEGHSKQSGNLKTAKKTVESKKETTSGEGLIKRSLSQEELLLKALDGIGEKKAKKGALVQWAKEEEKEKEHAKKSLFEKPGKEMKMAEWEPTKDSILMQFSWKVKELNELKNSSWFMSSELDESEKNLAEKLFAKLKREISELCEQYGKAKKSFGRGSKAVEDMIQKSQSLMGVELNRETKKSVSPLDELVSVIKGGDSLIEMSEDSTDLKKLASVHENSDMGERHPNKSRGYDKAMKQAASGDMTKSKSQNPFVKAVGKGGVVMDFGFMTGNPIADRTTLLLQQTADPTQAYVANYQDASYKKALADYVKDPETFGQAASGEDRPSGGVDKAWANQLNKPMDQQVAEAFQKGEFNEKQAQPNTSWSDKTITLNGEVLKGMSETDAAVIEMMKSAGVDAEPTGFVADVTGGGAERVVADCTASQK